MTDPVAETPGTSGQAGLFRTLWHITWNKPEQGETTGTSARGPFQCGQDGAVAITSGTPSTSWTPCTGNWSGWNRADRTNWIVNAPTTLAATRRYFENAGTPGCKAGMRFLVVTSDGALQPCSMQFRRYRLEDRSRMIREFTAGNRCDDCYVSIRSYLDKTFPQLLWENVTEFLSFRRH